MMMGLFVIFIAGGRYAIAGIFYTTPHWPPDEIKVILGEAGPHTCELFTSQPSLFISH